jgi:hypothetical protein
MSLQAKIASNSSRPCRHGGCSGRRKALSPYCRLHAVRVERYGHPDGKPINPKEYAVERARVADFLERHASHEGLINALKWLQKWLDAARRADAATLGSENVPGARELRQVAEHGVTPLQLLTEAAALFMYSQHQRGLPDDDRLTWAIGVRVLTMAPRERRYGMLHGKPRYWSRSVGKVARREVGRRIRTTLAPLLVNIVQGIEAERSEKQREALSLHKPFVSTVALPKE